MFLKWQRHHSIHAKVREIFDPIYDIENLADSMRPNVFIFIILRVEYSNVKLVDNEVVERRRPKFSVMPRIIGRIADNTVAIRIAVKFQLARIRVALEPFAAGSDDKEAIEVTVFDSWYEARPKALGILYEQIASVFWKGYRRCTCILLHSKVHLTGGRRACATRRSAE